MSLSRIERRLRWLPTSVIVSSAILLFNCLRRIRGDRWLRLVGDDSFYYLSIARVFTSKGLVSASQNPDAITNGFHPLWLLPTITSLFSTRNNPWNTFWILTSLNVILWTLCGFVLYVMFRSLVHRHLALLFLVTFMGSPLLIPTLFAGLENVLYSLFFSVCCVRLLSICSSTHRPEHFPRTRWLFAPSIGGIDVALLSGLFLSRTEGLVLGALFCVLVLLRYPRASWRYVSIWFGIVVSWLLLNKIVCGSISQSSTLFYRTYLRPRISTSDALSNWWSFFDFGPTAWNRVPPLRTLSSALLSPGLLIGLTLIGIGVVIFDVLRHKSLFRCRLLVPMTIVLSVLITSGYASLAQGTPPFDRYRITALIAFLVLASSLLACLGTLNWTARPTFLESAHSLSHRWFSLLLLTGILFVHLDSVNATTRAVLEASQQGPDERSMFVDSGLELRRLTKMNKQIRVASLNSGILGYFSGLRVLNIDGRVNSEIFSQGDGEGPIDSIPELFKYLKSKEITHFVDGRSIPSYIMMFDYHATFDCVDKAFIYERHLSRLHEAWYGGVALFKIADVLPKDCLTEPVS